MSKKENVLQDSADTNQPAHVLDWLRDQLRHTFEVPPSLDTSLSVLDDFDLDEFHYVVDACMATCGFRPTKDDVQFAAAEHSMRTFLDLAKVLKVLYLRRPNIDGLVDRLTLNNCAVLSRPFWKLFLELPDDRYNDHSVIECFIRGTDEKPSAVFDSLLSCYSRNLRNVSAERVEESLRRCGYRFVADKQNRWAAGDIIKLQKEADYDSFVQFAIVTQSDSRQSIEFKASTVFPMKVTLEGFELFFFRDSETVLKGIWTLNEPA